MKKVSVSVREIAEFLYGSASITNERVLLQRAQEGLEIHSFWQNQYLDKDRKEVTVETVFSDGDIELLIRGRIDGVIIK